MKNIFIVSLLMSMLVGSSAFAQTSDVPVISRIEPKTVALGEAVTIYGSNLTDEARLFSGNSSERWTSILGRRDPSGDFMRVNIPKTWVVGSHEIRVVHWADSFIVSNPVIIEVTPLLAVTPVESGTTAPNSGSREVGYPSNSVPGGYQEAVVDPETIERVVQTPENLGGPTGKCTVNGKEVDCAELMESVGTFAKWGFGIFIGFLLLGLVCLVFWAVMFIHAIKNPIDNKAIWIICFILFGVVTAIIYYFTVKRSFASQAAVSPIVPPTAPPGAV